MNPLRQHPIITWFVSNPVVANILMFCILAMGVRTAMTIQKEGFPAFDSETVSVEVPILGGTPQDVERGVSMKIEEALLDVDGIDHVRSTSTESKATVTIEAKENYDLSKLLSAVKTQVDAISSFPEQAEKPIVSDNQRQRDVLWVEVFGDVSEAVRKETARNLRDELLRQPAISQVEMFGARDYEISIEPSEEKLRFYNLTFDELATAVSENSFDLGSGMVRSPRGDIALRSREQAYVASDFEKIPVRTNPDGTRVLIRDVAEVRDAFVDQKTYNRFRGEPTTSLKITTEGQDDIVDAVEQAQAVVETFDGIPEGLAVTHWLDGSTNIRDRLTLLTSNGLIGVCLVLGILMLFLNLRLAFWVAIGIPVSLAGAITFFPFPGVDMTLNAISAFGFLVVLGIIVDDAIVIGEAIYAEKEKQDPDADNDHQTQLQSTVKGVSRVVTPATFGVITTLAAFLPLTQVSGRMGNVLGQIAAAVILCLIFSLVESKLILPAHLAHIDVHRKPSNPISRAWSRFQGLFSNGLSLFVGKVYLPTLNFLICLLYTSPSPRD